MAENEDFYMAVDNCEERALSVPEAAARLGVAAGP
jgi:hypothetical protein